MSTHSLDPLNRPENLPLDVEGAPAEEDLSLAQVDDEVDQDPDAVPNATEARPHGSEDADAEAAPDS